jgi:hypothetical protein
VNIEENTVKKMPKQRTSLNKRPVKTKLFRKDRRSLRIAMIRNYLGLGSFRKVGRLLSVHPFKVSYWNRKVKDPEFHPGKHGGCRSIEKFPKTQNENILKIILTLLSRNRSLNLKQLRLKLIEVLKYSFSLNTLSTFLKRNRWSWKVST